MLPLAMPAIEPLDLRPALHFTAPKGWLNDPNGLVFANGKYHLYYQHNPFGTQWGNMTWGHAVSTDLLHWEHLPHALSPDSMGTMYSGSAVVDSEGVLGKGRGAVALFYTAAGGENLESKGRPYTQCLAWTTDGVAHEKWPTNPIVGHIEGQNRDPKVVWHGPSRQWVMALYLAGDRFTFLGSRDLSSWTRLSDHTLPGASECPDLFELSMGRSRHWVFWAANGRYQVGEFDGTKFVPKTAVQESYFGNTGYAAQVYSNEPKGRCIQIAWMRGSEFPGTPWNQQMALPNRLTLKQTETGPKLHFWPVEELERLRGRRVAPDGNLYPVSSGLLDFEGEWSVPPSGTLHLEVNGVSVMFDALFRRLTVLDRSVQVPIRDGKLRLRGVADRASLELYVQQGEILMPLFVLPAPSAFQGVRGPDGWRGSLNVYPLARPAEN